MSINVVPISNAAAAQNRSMLPQDQDAAVQNRGAAMPQHLSVAPHGYTQPSPQLVWIQQQMMMQMMQQSMMFIPPNTNFYFKPPMNGFPPYPPAPLVSPHFPMPPQYGMMPPQYGQMPMPPQHGYMPAPPMPMPPHYGYGPGHHVHPHPPVVHPMPHPGPGQGGGINGAVQDGVNTVNTVASAPFSIFNNLWYNISKTAVSLVDTPARFLLDCVKVVSDVARGVGAFVVGGADGLNNSIDQSNAGFHASQNPFASSKPQPPQYPQHPYYKQ
ncbi:hypothetical protein CS022_22235 [Veronia nyctiphanis]|uniref:Uncharacterized protein n=1 Tax=Veronia nyctiphanis TaxID=1278244 RepID=A0A4Q0YJG0_9GAMM|nr:hypothetical protein [Veronia nyctiphanis]RXJ70847.1 hypothetical protein CS022_22235 [Veronia nyctiphanis]